MAQTVVFSFLPFATQLGLVPITSSWIIPLRLAGLSSPGAPRSLSRPSCCWAPGLGMGLLQRGPGSEPLALTLRRSSSLCHGPGRPAPRQLHTQQAPVSAQCRFCSMSTSCSSHVASVLPNGRPLPVGAAGTTGKRGTRLGWRGQGSQPLTLLSRLEMCLFQSARSGHPSLPVCQLSASLSVQHLHFSSAQRLCWERAIAPGFLSGPASWQFTFLLHWTSFSASMIDGRTCI